MPSRVETLREIAKSAKSELGAGEEERKRKRKENKRGEEQSTAFDPPSPCQTAQGIIRSERSKTGIFPPILS